MNDLALNPEYAGIVTNRMGELERKERFYKDSLVTKAKGNREGI